ncbi:Brain protein I3 [Fukomys damarensis]|uniref:Membrane protein BRI3 n=1 Tax=Fukomys damarensis TaxID=885580 RepID=A0A091D496_FUKDA|nr:Brain protein I3 [Fukomys damarensis]
MRRSSEAGWQCLAFPPGSPRSSGHRWQLGIAGGRSPEPLRPQSIHSRTVTRYPANSIVVVGGCPVCRVGVLEDCFTFLGIFLAIILFPFGFICCFALRKRRCPNCGATFT